MTCDKVTYDTYQLAINAAHGSSRSSGKSMKAYRCGDCGKYHLATQGKKKGIRYVQNLSMQPVYKKGKRVEVNAQKGNAPGRQPKQIYATEKLLSKEQADSLKRLIEGSSQLEKQKVL